MSNDHGAAYWCDQYRQLEARSKAKILELEQRVKVLTDALEIELGVWKYDAKYGTSNYSRIHVDMRIRAIEKALAQTKQQPAFQEDGIRFKATVIWDHKTETIEGVLQKESKE